MNPVIKTGILSDEIYVVDTKPVKCAHLSGNLSPEQAVRKQLDDAMLQAEEIIRSAQFQAAGIREDACREGYEKARAEFADKTAALEKKAKDIQKEAEKQVEDFWAETEPELLKLAVDIARQVIGKKIEEDDSFVLSTVKSGLRQLRDKREIKIRVSPDDVEFMRAHKDDVAVSCEGVNAIEIIDDRRIDRGGCLIETANGDLDARMETQLGEVERALLEAERDGKNAA